ncbi:MAG: hypothetical protein MJY95_01800 [Bacteroidaceae bacterium]|nr:hypothetical protein [Bacteroidaceae bacterium]
MKNLLKFSFALLLGAMMFAACSDDDSDNLPKQDEVEVDILGVTDTTVTVMCYYHPNLSETYQLRIGKSVSEEYSKERCLKILHLHPGNTYTLSVLIYDANHKTLGKSDVKFKTSGKDTGFKPSTDDEILDGAADQITFAEVEE